MLIKKRGKDNYLVTIFIEELNNNNINSKLEGEKIIDQILEKIIKDGIKDGIIFVDTYIDGNYGLIMEITRKKVWGNNNLNIHFNFFLDRAILYEGDYFLTKMLPKNSYKIYYHNQKFYIELVNLIEKDLYLKLLENSSVIIDKENIKNKGIKV